MLSNLKLFADSDCYSLVLSVGGGQMTALRGRVGQETKQIIGVESDAVQRLLPSPPLPSQRRCCVTGRKCAKIDVMYQKGIFAGGNTQT